MDEKKGKKREIDQSPDREDDQYIDVVQRGEAGRENDVAWKELQSRYYPKLVKGMMARNGGNREEAEDAAANAFLKAHRAIQRFARGSSFFTWLYRIALNDMIDAKRRSHSTKMIRIEDMKPGRGDEERTGDEDNAEHLLDRQRLGERLRHALKELETLNPEPAEVLRLREWEDLSYREIAARTGVPEGTVMSRLFYARERMRQLLSETPASPSHAEPPRNRPRHDVPHDVPRDAEAPSLSGEQMIALLQQEIDMHLAKASADRATAEEAAAAVRKRLEDIV